MIRLNCHAILRESVSSTNGNLYILDLNEAIVIWKRGTDEILFQDEDEVTDDPRFQLHKEGSVSLRPLSGVSFQNFTLIINKAEPYDTAEYTCSVTSPELSLTHKVQVNGTLEVFSQVYPF